MEGKFGDKVVFTGANNQELLGFVTKEGDPATLVVFDDDGSRQVQAAYRGKEDGQREGSGRTYRALSDR